MLEINKFFLRIAVCAVIASTFAFYEKGDVVELTPSNFDRLVIQSDEIWIIEVSKWEWHRFRIAELTNSFQMFSFMRHGVDIANSLFPNIQNLQLHWKALSKSVPWMPTNTDRLVDSMELKVRYLIMNEMYCWERWRNWLLWNYFCKGFPTIKIFGANKRSPIDYNNQRTAQAMADAALAEAKKKVSEKLGGRSSGGSSGGDGNGDVIELTDSNFDKLVLQSDDVWLVEVIIFHDWWRIVYKFKIKEHQFEIHFFS